MSAPITPRRKANDLFAGCGGFTLAAELEDVQVVNAINHWDKAVEVHKANHPRTHHVREDLCGFDFETLDAFDMLLAGPACQPASRAGQVGRKRSAKVYDDHVQMRATMHAITKCLRVCRPKVMVVENVPEVDQREDMAAWRRDVEGLGYTVTDQVLCASRFGVPQRRYRRFYIGVHKGPAIHVADPDVAEAVIQSAFDASAPGWVDIDKMRKTETKRDEPVARERVEYANAKLGGDLGWGVHVSHRGAWGRRMDEPVTTLTTRAGQLWWVRDGQYRLWTVNERKAATGFPLDYDLCGATQAEAAKLLGNAVPPGMARAVIRAAKQAFN